MQRTRYFRESESVSGGRQKSGRGERISRDEGGLRKRGEAGGMLGGGPQDEEGESGGAGQEWLVAAMDSRVAAGTASVAPREVGREQATRRVGPAAVSGGVTGVHGGGVEAPARNSCYSPIIRLQSYKSVCLVVLSA